MSHVADSPINRHFEPISGHFTPSGRQISAKSGRGQPLSGAREAWLARNVPLATDLPRLATTSFDQSSLTPRPMPSAENWVRFSARSRLHSY
jgi:hypothetical protein